MDKNITSQIFVFLQRHRIKLTYILLPFLLLTHPSWKTLAIGIPVSILGLGIRVWASGYLMKNKELIREAPYNVVRHPLYLGTLIAGTGLSVSTGSLWFLLLFLIFYFTVYFPTMVTEEKGLQKNFPNKCEIYRQEVPLLIPRLAPTKTPSINFTNPSTKGLGFNLNLFFLNREYRAFLAWIALIIILVVKIHFGN